MSILTINADNHITAYTSAEEASQAGAGLTQFDSHDELTRISTEWPLSRLVDVWNSIPGNGKVNKFQDRKTAVARVWKALQPLAAQKPERRSTSQKLAKKPKAGTKSTTQAESAAQPVSDRTNKKAQVIAMMQRAKGATLAELMQATGWQKHTVRGFVSILGSKGGHTIESSKNAAGERTYRLKK